MDVTITEATQQDIDEIAVLLGEVEQYYGGENAPGNADEIYDALFSARPAATALLARADGVVVGFASYSFLWPAAGSTKSLYLKELYVRSAFRSRGVGQQLMDTLTRIGLAAGCSRMEWTGDTDNPSAMTFYEKMGVPQNGGKVFYRLPLGQA